MNKNLLLAGIILVVFVGGAYVYRHDVPRVGHLSRAGAVNKIRQALADPQYQKTCGIKGENLTFVATESYTPNHISFAVTDADSTNIFDVDEYSGHVDCNIADVE
jgi:hypothetical protein